MDQSFLLFLCFCFFTFFYPESDCSSDFVNCLAKAESARLKFGVGGYSLANGRPGATGGFEMVVAALALCISPACRIV